jgi:multicomponent Na+:H+ antiporter subunit E
MIVLRMVAFLGWYLSDLVSSQRRMVLAILAPRRVTPAVVRVDTRCLREVEVGLLGMLLTLGPGTVVLDAAAHAEDADAEHPWTLYVHSVHHADPEELRRSVVQMERRLLTALGRTDLGDGAR